MSLLLAQAHPHNVMYSPSYCSDSYLVTASCIDTLTFPDFKHETHP